MGLILLFGFALYLALGASKDAGKTHNAAELFITRRLESFDYEFSDVRITADLIEVDAADRPPALLSTPRYRFEYISFLVANIIEFYERRDFTARNIVVNFDYEGAVTRISFSSRDALDFQRGKLSDDEFINRWVVE